jgi:hypothetical protein
LTDNVNLMTYSNLTVRGENIADVATSCANGDLSKKITVDVAAKFRIENTLNPMVISSTRSHPK